MENLIYLRYPRNLRAGARSSQPASAAAADGQRNQIDASPPHTALRGTTSSSGHNIYVCIIHMRSVVRDTHTHTHRCRAGERMDGGTSGETGASIPPHASPFSRRARIRTRAHTYTHTRTRDTSANGHTHDTAVAAAIHPLCLPDDAPSPTTTTTTAPPRTARKKRADAAILALARIDAEADSRARPLAAWLFPSCYRAATCTRPPEHAPDPVAQLSLAAPRRRDGCSPAPTLPRRGGRPRLTGYDSAVPSPSGQQHTSRPHRLPGGRVMSTLRPCPRRSLSVRESAREGVLAGAGPTIGLLAAALEIRGAVETTADVGACRGRGRDGRRGVCVRAAVLVAAACLAFRC